MEVKLKRDWFYPVDAGPANDQRAISGGRYRKGTHTMPNELLPYLPSDAQVITENNDETPEASTEVVPDLIDADLDRAAAQAEDAILEKAEETRQALITKKRVAALAKARDAKKAKKEAAK